jgi:hypothetical protein
MRVAKCADNDGKSNATVRKMRGGEGTRQDEEPSGMLLLTRRSALQRKLFYSENKVQFNQTFVMPR